MFATSDSVAVPAPAKPTPRPSKFNGLADWASATVGSSGGRTDDQVRIAGDLKTQLGLDKIEFAAGTPANAAGAEPGRSSSN
jgi:hypothetical protein